MSGVWWKWEILCLEQESKPYLAFLNSVLTIPPHRLPWCHHYTPAYLAIQLLTSEVSADFYTRLIWNCKSCNTYNYIHTGNILTYAYTTDNQGSTTIQSVACTGSWSQKPVSWVWWNWEILCLELGIKPKSLAFRTSVLPIPPHRVPWCHHYTHAYLSVQLLASDVSADYYCYMTLLTILLYTM